MLVSIAVARAIVSHLGPAVACEDVGVEQQLLDDAQARVSALEISQLIHHASALTNDPSIGLNVGWSCPLHALQLFGHLLLSCRTMRDAINAIHRYTPLVADGNRWHLHEGRGQVHLVYKHDCRSVAAARFDAEFALSMAWRFAARYQPSAAAPELVRWRHDTPLYASRYEARFGCRNLFAQSECELVIAGQHLDRPQWYFDARLYNTLRVWADQALDRRRRNEQVAERVRAQLRLTPDLSRLDFEAMASSLSLTHQQLGRRLKRDGLTLSSLIDEARCIRACRQLREGVPVAQVTESLGFSEPSAFSRAFKRWMGVSPSQYRRSLCGERSQFRAVAAASLL